MITLGGWNDKGLKDIIVLDLEKGKWDMVVPTGPAMVARYGHTMNLYKENEIIVYGGRDDKVIKELGTLTITDTTRKEYRFCIVLNKNKQRYP